MNKSFHVDQNHPSAEVVNLAATRLRDGGVVVFPTETVYGLGALAEAGVCYGAEELFDIKERPLDIPIPLLVASPSDIDVYGTDVPEYAHVLARTFWPGALTLVVKASDRIRKEFRAADGSIGLRCPDSELMSELLEAAGGPIFATSANTHGLSSPTSFEQIEPRIIEAADMVIDGGPTDHGIASTVVVCTGKEYRVAREGAISSLEISEALA